MEMITRDCSLRNLGRRAPHLCLDDATSNGHEDQAFWWQKVGKPFASLMAKAGYSPGSQYRNLLFFHTEIIPEIGPGPGVDGRPQNWLSFMTDDFSPLELCWEWGLGGRPPAIRFSFEPIGLDAGTPLDPMNRHAAFKIVHRAQATIRNCDLEWFNFFLNMVSFSSPLAGCDDGNQADCHNSRLFAGFDILDDGLVLKAYFLPTSRAVELKISSWELVSRLITALPMYRIAALPSFDRLQAFISNENLSSRLALEIVAIDCVEPLRSRIKLYMRSHSTSFQSVKEIMTLSMSEAGKLHEQLANLERLQRLWYYVLDLDPSFPHTAELPPNNHRTAGTLYYFELRPGAQQPNVKVYIPVRHYAPNDYIIATGLLEYLRGEGKTDRLNEFTDALQCIRSKKQLEQLCGVQTYIGCSFTQNELKITSYLSPLAFSSM